MTEFDPKKVLHKYLTNARKSVLWKMEGLSEYDARRPLTPTGTNLLGLVKHLSSVEAGYFCLSFGKPVPDELRPFYEPDVELDVDLWATADESKDFILDLYRRVIDETDAVIDELPIDAVGRVPWWGDADVTLGDLLVHVVSELNRHCGHIDIVRELIDGSVGLGAAHTNMFDVDEKWWGEHHAKLTAIAESFR